MCSLSLSGLLIQNYKGEYVEISGGASGFASFESGGTRGARVLQLLPRSRSTACIKEMYERFTDRAPHTALGHCMLTSECVQAPRAPLAFGFGARVVCMHEGATFACTRAR
eukprot:5373945-Pleurochrysis_carterae.AAC.2